MLCPFCNYTIENDSIYCRFCGEKVVRSRKKAKDLLSVPDPIVIPSGRYRGRVMVNGQRVYITEDTEAAYYIRARAVKAGLIEQAKSAPRTTLKAIIKKYIDDNEAVLSPSTVMAYRSYLDNSFPAYMGQDPSSINYQRMVSEDSVRYSAKTIANAWRLVTVSLKYSKLPVPEVSLPRIVRKEKEFLDFDQIKTFISAARGDECEIYMLLALHSLRLSELLALNAGSFRGDVIHVRGAKIRSKDGMELRDLNKTDLSRRDVPIMIPRLKELIPQTSFPLVHSCGMINDHIEKICSINNLPKCTCHSLRHSFASLAYHLRWTEKSTMQLGGWSTTDVVHEVYTHLSSKDLNNDVQKMIDFYTST